MVRVIDSHQRVDACLTGGLELAALELAFIGWEYAEVDALQTHRGLLQVDELHTRNGLQNFGGSFHNTSDARMPVQGDPQRDVLDKVRFEVVELRPQEPEKRYHLKWLGTP